MMRFISSSLMLAASAVAVAAEPDALERAYQKEYAYLLAEKQELASRLAGFDADAVTRKQSAEREVDDLEARLIASRRAADLLEDDLGAMDRRSVTLADGQDAIANVLEQARDTLGVLPPEIPIDASDVVRAEAQATALIQVGEAAAARLRSATSVTRTEGEYFLPSGQQVRGPVVAIGEVAAIGLATGSEGALVPVGEGRLALVDPDPAARWIEGGSPPDSVRLYVFESRDKQVEPPKVETWRDTLEKSGTIGKAIVALGSVMWAMVLVRFVTLVVAQRGGSRLADRVIGLVREGRVHEARAVAASRSAMARVLRTSLDHPELDTDGLHTLAANALQREQATIDRFSTAILVCAAVAPPLGLLGTVSGMITAFNAITEFGTGNTKMLSAGIAEALVATEFGLMVAIPGLVVGNILNGQAKRIVATLEQGALLLVHHLTRSRHEPDPERSDEPSTGQPLRLAKRAHA